MCIVRPRSAAYTQKSRINCTSLYGFDWVGAAGPSCYSRTYAGALVAPGTKTPDAFERWSHSRAGRVPRHPPPKIFSHITIPENGGVRSTCCYTARTLPPGQTARLGTGLLFQARRRENIDELLVGIPAFGRHVEQGRAPRRHPAVLKPMCNYAV